MLGCLVKELLEGEIVSGAEVYLSKATSNQCSTFNQ